MSIDLRRTLDAYRADLSLEQASTPPASWYFDPSLHEAERHAVFAATWQYAGRAAQVAHPGSYFTTDIAGAPVLAVRGADGVLRAFHNVCRHRAARVATEAEGAATRFRCRYHGWTYDLAGRLRGAPEMEGAADFDPAEHSLPALDVDSWGPFVFVRASRNAPAQRDASLQDLVAPLHERIAVADVYSLKFAGRREYELNCNWKVYVDNYLDGGYHVNSIHPALAGALEYREYRTEIHGASSIQVSPMREGASAARRGTTAYYGWLFPNFMLNLYQGAMDTNVVLPLGAERCRVVFDFYSDGSIDATQSIAFADEVQAQDAEICEDVQRGLRSGAFESGRYSVRREAGVHHFHRLLAQALQRGDAASAAANSAASRSAD